MTQRPTPGTAAMQGAGFYNRHSALQAANLGSACPCLRMRGIAGDHRCATDRHRRLRAVAGTQLAAADAHGHRCAPCPGRERAADRSDPQRSSWQRLPGALHAPRRKPASYLAGRAHVYPSAIGRSFFGPFLPPGRFDVGWSSNALHWPSRNPVDVPDLGWAVFSASEDARAAVDRQLAPDWSDFLQARAAELAQRAAGLPVHGTRAGQSRVRVDGGLLLAVPCATLRPTGCSAR